MMECRLTLLRLEHQILRHCLSHGPPCHSLYSVDPYQYHYMHLDNDWADEEDEDADEECAVKDSASRD
jgi:hypothetical protein